MYVKLEVWSTLCMISTLCLIPSSISLSDETLSCAPVFWDVLKQKHWHFSFGVLPDQRTINLLSSVTAVEQAQMFSLSPHPFLKPNGIPDIIDWTGPFPIIGICCGFLSVIKIWIKYCGNVESQIRCRAIQCLIWGCTTYLLTDWFPTLGM